MAAELRAARGWKESWENMQTTVQHGQADRRREGAGSHGGKGSGLESGLAAASRRSLNKAGERVRNTGRGGSKRAAGPGLPRTHRQLSSWLPAGERSSHPSHFHPSPLRNDHQFPPSPLRKPPIQSLSFFTSPATSALVHSAASCPGRRSAVT